MSEVKKREINQIPITQLAAYLGMGLKKHISRLLLRIKPLYKRLSISQERQLETIAGYVDKNGCPLECPKCGCKETKQTNEDYIDGHILCEYSLRCKKCDYQLGYWAYGSWML